tara:strand:+ start:24951 stop:25622 length:672 start_codon:yes stop_codon:yes gene_type:complete
MNTKTKLTLVAALFLGAVSLNAAEESSFSGSASTKYTSDYARRGALVSTEAAQASIGFSTEVSEFDVYGDFFTSQSTDAGVDSDEFTIGVGTDLFEDTINASIGLYNTDFSGADNALEYFVQVQLNTALTPTISFFDDTDESLQTFEGSLSYNVDTDLVDLNLGGLLGSTDTLASDNQTYTGLTAVVSKDISEDFNVFTDISFSDAESRDYETVWGIGLNLNF